MPVATLRSTVRRCGLVGLTMAAPAAGLGQAPAPEPRPDIRWEVRITRSASGLVDVRGTFPAEALLGRSRIRLEFLDARRHPGQLDSISAWANGRPLQVRQLEADGSAYEVAVHSQGTRDAVIVEYTIDPTFYPPGSRAESPADARSRVTQDLAVIRTASLFPRLDLVGPGTVVFSLPAGWTAVTPWIREGDAFELSHEEQRHLEYLGLGPFDVREVAAGGMPLRVAALRADSGLGTDAVVSLLEMELELAGVPPGDGGPRSVVIVPEGFMRGGAAGRHSVVQPPDAMVLAHELFHWWTHSGLTRPEATWFLEGFTNYYGIKAVLRAGLWTMQEAHACLADLSAEMRYLEKDGPESLEAVSRRYREGQRARRLVYSKGALLAFLLDRELEARGRSLDEVMRAVFAERRAGLGTGDLRDRFSQVYGDLVDDQLEGYVIQGEALPDLGLGAATGRSGCARELPDRQTERSPSHE